MCLNGYIGIHLGWAMQAPPGWTLSHNDWPKTARKGIPSPLNLRLWATWHSSPPGFPHPPALLLGGPLANQVSCLVSTGVSWDNSFPSVTREPPLKPWKGSPFLQKGDTQYQTAIRKARTVGGEFGEEWIHVYEWLRLFTVQLKLSQHYESAEPQCKIHR